MFRAILLVAVVAGVAAAHTPSEAVRFAPAGYNTVTVINVSSILKTPRAVKEKWAEKDHTEYLAGAIPFHPSVETIVATAEFRLNGRDAGPSAVIAPLRKQVDLAAVAKAVSGEATTVAGEPAVLTRNGLYLVKLGDDLLGGLRTDHRQDVGRWVRAVKEKQTTAPSRYLGEAIGTVGTNQIQIAVDVEDMFTAKDVATALAFNKGLEADPKAAAAVGGYLAGLRGVRLAANVSDASIRLVIALDSSVQPGVKPEVLKDVVVELVERAGAGLQDLRAATPAVELNRFTLTLNVTDDELAHITGLVLPPPPPTGDVAKIGVVSGAVTREATARYVAAADRVVSDLKKKYEKATDYPQTALWHDTAARRLASLSVLGADPKAIGYVQGTAQVLHEIGESLRGVPVQVGRLQQSAYYIDNTLPNVVWYPRWGFRFTPYWMWNYGTVSTNLPEVRAKQAEVIANDKENRAKLWGLIDSQRRELTSALSGLK
jgi:hypothetical protein